MGEVAALPRLLVEGRSAVLIGLPGAPQRVEEGLLVLVVTPHCLKGRDVLLELASHRVGSFEPHLILLQSLPQSIQRFGGVRLVLLFELNQPECQVGGMVGGSFEVVAADVVDFAAGGTWGSRWA